MGRSSEASQSLTVGPHSAHHLRHAPFSAGQLPAGGALLDAVPGARRLPVRIPALALALPLELYAFLQLLRKPPPTQQLKTVRPPDVPVSVGQESRPVAAGSSAQDRERLRSGRGWLHSRAGVPFQACCVGGLQFLAIAGPRPSAPEAACRPCHTASPQQAVLIIRLAPSRPRPAGVSRCMLARQRCVCVCVCYSL